MTDFDLGLRCGHFLSMKDGETHVEHDIFVGISGPRIVEVANWREDHRGRCREWIDGSNFAVIPGLINAHTHLAMTLFRGFEDDAPFHQWLMERILPLEAKLVDREFVQAGSWLGIAECLRFGVTTVADMYFYADAIAEVIDQAGLRGLVSQVFAKGPLPEDSSLGRNKGDLFLKLHDKYKDHGRVIPALGPHAPYTCSDEIWRQVRDLSERHAAPVLTHLCETAGEVQGSLKEFKKTPVQRLYDLGVMTDRLKCAHGVHVSDSDMKLMKDSGACVIYNPDSNLKLGSGIAPIRRYKEAGIPIAIGTDGAASNNDLSLFGAMDVGVKLQKLDGQSTTPFGAADGLRLATWEGARALGLEKRIGSIEPGKDADVVLLDLNFPHLQPLHDLRSQLVYAAQGLEVDTVICQGRVLLRNKKFCNFDYSRILADVERQRKKIEQAGVKL